MKKHLLLFTFVFLFSCFLRSQSQGNIGFEYGNLTGAWQGAYNNGNCGASTPNPMTIIGLDTLGTLTQHQVVSIGYDPSVTLSQLPVNNPFIGNYSVRLGNIIDDCGAAQLTYTIWVMPSQLSFSIFYALVFNDNGGHAFKDAPKFIYKLINLHNGFSIAADTILYSISDTSFHHGSNNPAGIVYTKWNQLCFDLTPYIGEPVMVEFITSDCDSGTHRGYAYLDFFRNSLSCIQTSVNPVNSQLWTISVYPNPVNNYINLTFKNLQNDEFEITLSDIQGNILVKENFASGPGQINKTYKTENLPRGIYFVSIKTKQQGTIQKKVILN